MPWHNWRYQAYCSSSPGNASALEHQELGAHQPNAFGARYECILHILQGGNRCQQADTVAIGGLRRDTRQTLRQLDAPLGTALVTLQPGKCLRIRAYDDHPCVAIHDKQLLRSNQAQRPAQPNHRRHPQSPRHNCRMRRNAADHRHKPHRTRLME
jgi:hypothetical protein